MVVLNSSIRSISLSASFIFLTALFLPVARAQSIFDAPTRGQIISLTALPSMSCSRENGPPISVARYRLRYTTIDVLGGLSPASGLIAFRSDSNQSKPVVTYLHGAAIKRDAVPSYGVDEANTVTCIFAADDYIVVAPDYLGLADSPGFHPYMHSESIATMGTDMLRALPAALAKLKMMATGSLFLTGYSQGGHSTLALHRALENSPLETFRLAASAPLAGPYDLSGISLETTLKSPRPYYSSFYVAYLLSSYQRLYGNLWKNPSEVFAGDYSDLPSIFDEHCVEGLSGHLPDSPEKLLTSSFMKSLEGDSHHPLREDLKRNDVYDWKPKAKVHFFFAGSDRDVSPKNAQAAYSRMRQLGADVGITDVGEKLDHQSGFVPSLEGARRFFDSVLVK